MIYCVAQFRGVALLVSWLFGISYQAAVITGTALVVTFVVISGTLGVVRNQRLQYFVLIVAFILPLMFLTKNWVISGLYRNSAMARPSSTCRPSSVFLVRTVCLDFTVQVAGALFYPDVRDCRSAPRVVAVLYGSQYP
jgi:Predicted symporter